MKINELVVVVVVAVCSIRSAAVAQVQGKIVEQPIITAYVRDFTPVRMIAYVQNLAERLEIGAETIKQFNEQPIREMTTKAVEPIAGNMWFMVQGFVPSFTSVSFQQVVDEQDARRILNAQKDQFGENGQLEGSDGNFKLTNSWSWQTEVPEGTVATEQSNIDNPGFTMKSRIIEKDGKRFQEHSQTYSQYFRYHDQFLFQSASEQVWDMSLPTSETLFSGAPASRDMGVEAFSDRVPIGIKHLAWNMLNSTTGTFLQQRDEEDIADYELRRNSGNLGLSIVQSLLFDVDYASGWASFASEDQPIRGELKFRSRKGSSFGASLHDLSSCQSRFGPFLRDDAAATVHMAVKLPEQASDVLTAAGRWLEKTIAEETGTDVDLVLAAGELSQTLGGLAEHRNLELMLKLGWSEASGGVIYGGLQVDDNPQLLENLLALMQGPEDGPALRIDSFRMTELDGMPYIEVRFPDVSDQFPVNISRGFLAHHNSSLWFAAGGGNAYRMIQSMIAKTTESGLAIRTPILTAELDLEKWLSYPADDETGLCQLPRWVDDGGWLPYAEIGEDFTKFKFNPLIDRVIALGGSQAGRFVVRADESGVLLQAEMGEALGNYYIARMLDLIDGQMSRIRESAEEAEVQTFSDAPIAVEKQ